MILVLLPGLDGTGDLFGPFLAQIQERQSIVIIRYPVDEMLTYDELESLVRNSLPEKDDFVLLAESFSGPIAYKIALKPPGNLKKVIFVATFLNSPRPILLNIASILPLSIIFKIPIPNSVINAFLLGSKASEDLRSQFKKVLKMANANVLAFRLREISRLKVQIRKISIPITYIKAKNDGLVPSQNVELFKKLSNKIKIIELPGPHFILQANPEGCANVVAKSAF
jgi:pimeloyl-ACP methyl ester carboxylesterase